MPLHQNYRLYHQDGEVYAVRDNVETDPELFRRTGQTENIRTVAAADAVIHDDLLLDVVVEDGRVILQDPWSGVKERFYPPEWLEPSLATFERVDPIFNEGEN